MSLNKAAAGVGELHKEAAPLMLLLCFRCSDTGSYPSTMLVRVGTHECSTTHRYHRVYYLFCVDSACVCYIYIRRWVCDDEQVRPLHDTKRLVANEVQILMYCRRYYSGIALGLHSTAASCPTNTYQQHENLTRTRILFGEHGDVVSTTKEPVGTSL